VSKTQSVVAALLAGLLAGTWLGFSLDRSALRRMRKRGPDVERIVEKLSRDLKLDAAQAAKVREAMESRRARHEALRKEHAERFSALRAEIDADIEKLLTEEQKKAFAASRLRWEKRRAQR
jgi:Spy/CpxP family protein refolding chaperone